MKKFAFLTAMALCLGFTACDDYEEPNPDSQKNPQEAIFEVDGVSVYANTAQYDLAALDAEGKLADVLTVDAANVPDGYQVSMVMQLSKDDSFANYAEVETTTDGNIIYVDPKVLGKAYKENLTKDPAAATVKVRYAGYLVNKTSKSRIGDPDTYFGIYDLSLVPLAADKLIEKTYRLEHSIDGVKWSEGVEFAHSSASPYDDPEFSLAFTFTSDMLGENGVYWRIVSGAGHIFGVSEEEAFNDKGNLVEGAAPAVSFLEGPVLFNINMSENTFSYIQAIECFWTPGQSNGWSFDERNQIIWTNDYNNYYGFIYLDKEFKLSPNPEWKGDFGCDGGMTYTQAEDGHCVGTGVAKGSKNINVETPGVYWVELNYGTKDLKLTECKVIGLIGGFNGWGATAAMTPSADYLTWTGTFTFSAGDEWKFRANDNWDINLGGSLDNLTPGGDNLKCAEAGEYVITLNLKARPYTATVVKK